MAMPEGTKKWTTLATWSDDAVVEYFQTVRGQTRRHALNSLTMLRRQFDEHGGKRAVPLTHYEPRLSGGSTPATAAPAVASVEPPASVQIVPPFYSSTPAPAAPAASVEPAATPAPAAPAFEPEIKVQGEKTAAGETLAALVAPHMGDVFAPVIADAVKQMHAHLAAHQASQIVVIRNGGEPRKLDGAQHCAAAKLISLTSAGLNVMLVGPAGCGKTVMAGSVAQAFDRKLTAISCSAGMSEAQLLGRLLPLGDGGAFKYVESPFVKAYREGGVILLDEMDAADPNLLLVINAALANGFVEIEARAANGLDVRVERHPETIITAAANTWGSGADTQYIGRGALDVSTLDRFYRFAVDYDPVLERQLGAPEHVVAYVQTLRAKARDAKLRRVVSTRMIVRITKALAVGISFEDAIADELASWTRDERSKVGA